MSTGDFLPAKLAKELLSHLPISLGLVRRGVTRNFDGVAFDFVDVHVAHFTIGAHWRNDIAEPAGVRLVIIRLPLFEYLPFP